MIVTSIHTWLLWNYPLGGDHGYTDKKTFTNKQERYGFHLMQKQDQIIKLKSMGLSTAEISNVLGKLYFNDDVNQHSTEYYQRVLTESEFLCLKYDEMDNINISKRNPDAIKDIRKNIPNAKLSTLGIRVLLSKSHSSPLDYLTNY